MSRVVSNVRVLRMPPRIKILEAMGAIADGRVEKIGPRRYRVISSEGDRVYNVYVDPDSLLVFSDDNGTRYRGYVGYPIIAVLMLEGIIPYDKEVAEALRDIPWRKLNETYKRYALVEKEVKRIAAQRGVPANKIDETVDKAMQALRGLRLRLAPSMPLV